MLRFLSLVFMVSFVLLTNSTQANTDRVCNVFPAGCGDGNPNQAQVRAQCCPAPGGVPNPIPPPPPPPTTGNPPGRPPITPPITPPPCPGTGGVRPMLPGGFGGNMGGNDNCPPPTPPCVDTVTTGDWGECEGAFGPWDKISHTRTYEGSECRTITTTNSCGGSSSSEDCRPCSYEESDNGSPTCESVVDWLARPIESVVLSCEDDLSGCLEEDFTNGQVLSGGGGVAPASACDAAGNCVECTQRAVDVTPPTCTATFLYPGRWHRDEDFEINGGPVRCWLESCEDPDSDGDGEDHVASGCLPFETLENTQKVFNDPGGILEQIQVEQDPLIQEHRDFCVMQVCDNAGNCSTCKSPEIGYDGTNVCRSAIGFCGECDEGDYDCRCISGERDQCANSGPVNCYADPFDERCPGFDNPACLEDAFIPGCPVFNPCYPESNRTHSRIGQEPECPEDAIRFCARNPYHFGCNEACRLDLIDCEPEPSINTVGLFSTSGSGGNQDTGGTGDNCPPPPECDGELMIERHGGDIEGCPSWYCSEPGGGISHQLAELGDACPGSHACMVDLICSTENGVCNRNPGCSGDTCSDECWGTCVSDTDACPLFGLPGCTEYEMGDDGCANGICIACADGYELINGICQEPFSCPEPAICPSGFTLVIDGEDEDGCPTGHCASGDPSAMDQCLNTGQFWDELTNTCHEEQIGCVENDDGFDIRNRSIIYGYRAADDGNPTQREMRVRLERQDFCLDPDTLYEYGCNSDGISSSGDTINCANGCIDGACAQDIIQCPDVPACVPGEVLVERDERVNGCANWECADADDLNQGQPDDACPGSYACEEGLICSTRYGDCDNASDCTAGSGCSAQCWGTCVQDDMDSCLDAGKFWDQQSNTCLYGRIDCSEDDEGYDLTTRGQTFGFRTFSTASDPERDLRIRTGGEDTCLDDIVLREYRCDEEDMISSMMSCPHGCEAGRCRENPAQ